MADGLAQCVAIARHHGREMTMTTSEKIDAAKAEFDALFRDGKWSSEIDARMGLLGRRLYRLRRQFHREQSEALA